MTRLALENIAVSLGQRMIVENATARLKAGQFVALLGPNGAGKTTMLRAIAGLQPLVRGAVRLDGVDIHSLSPAARARRISYLPQGHQTHWPLPVRDIVALGRYAHGATDPRRLSAKDAEAVAAAMARAGVTDFAESPATALSGGEKARVSLARALATEAPVLLADEPTASLDPSYQLAVMEVLQGIARAGALVVAVTHDLDHALRFADRALVLASGRLVADASPEAALDDTVLASVFSLRPPRPAAGRWERLP